MKATNILKAASGVAILAMALSANAQVTTTGAGSSASAPHETVGEKVDNGALTTKVKTSLAAQSNLKALHIHVKSTNGVVRLTGTVPDATQRSLAGETAANVSGVKSVRNNLKIDATK
jgi:osmotically-inducible protein OsmY